MFVTRCWGSNFTLCEWSIPVSYPGSVNMGNDVYDQCVSVHVLASHLAIIDLVIFLHKGLFIDNTFSWGITILNVALRSNKLTVHIAGQNSEYVINGSTFQFGQ